MDEGQANQILEALAEALEERQRLGYWRDFDELEVNHMKSAPREIRLRLLRACCSSPRLLLVFFFLVDGGRSCSPQRSWRTTIGGSPGEGFAAGLDFSGGGLGLRGEIEGALLLRAGAQWCMCQFFPWSAPRS